MVFFLYSFILFLPFSFKPLNTNVFPVPNNLSQSFQCEWKLDRPSKMVYFLSLNEQELQKYFTDVKRTELWDNLELEDIVSIVINREKWRKQMTVCWLDRRAAHPLGPETVLVRENRKRIHLRQIPAEEYDG